MLGGRSGEPKGRGEDARGGAVGGLRRGTCLYKNLDAEDPKYRRQTKGGSFFVARVIDFM